MLSSYWFDTVIEGLVYLPGYLGPQSHDRLLIEVDRHPWQMSVGHNVQIYGYHYSHRRKEAFRIGHVPPWAADLARRLHADGHTARVPNQLVVNEYPAGTGIFEHQDQAVFGDVVVSISLGSTCVMRFTREGSDDAKEILLEPASALVLTGEARWEWKHGIPARDSDVVDGREYVRGRRISLTFRDVPEPVTEFAR